MAELTLGVRIAIQTEELQRCSAFDGNGDGAVSVNELIEGVGAALGGCAVPPVPTPTPDPTALLSVEAVLRAGDPGLESLTGLEHITVGPIGRHVYVASPGIGAVTVLAVEENTNRLLLRQVLSRFASESGDEPLESLASAQLVVVSPDGRNAYVPTLGGGFNVFSRSDEDGTLTFAKVFRLDCCVGFNGATDGVFSADGSFLYTTGLTKVAVFRRDELTGDLEELQNIRPHSPGGGETSGDALAMSPDGMSVYVAGSGDHRLSVFERDPESGELGFVEEHVRTVLGEGIVGLLRVQSVVVSPDGANVYTASTLVDRIVVFNRNQDTGRLTLVEEISVADPAWLAASPSGRILFVSRSKGSVGAFGIDDAGRLTHLDDVRIGTSGGMLAVGPSDRVLYAAADRNVLTGIRVALPGPTPG